MVEADGYFLLWCWCVFNHLLSQLLITIVNCQRHHWILHVGGTGSVKDTRVRSACVLAGRTKLITIPSSRLLRGRVPMVLLPLSFNFCFFHLIILTSNRQGIVLGADAQVGLHTGWVLLFAAYVALYKLRGVCVQLNSFYCRFDKPCIKHLFSRAEFSKILDRVQSSGWALLQLCRGRTALEQEPWFFDL